MAWLTSDHLQRWSVPRYKRKTGMMTPRESLSDIVAVGIDSMFISCILPELFLSL
jgi:hypothetical protein